MCLFLGIHSQGTSLTSVGKQKRQAFNDYMEKTFADYESELFTLASVMNDQIRAGSKISRLTTGPSLLMLPYFLYYNPSIIQLFNS